MEVDSDDTKRNLCKEVLFLLGNTEESVLSHIMSELVKLGVSVVEDLQWVEEDDLKDVIKPVHARKLMRNYRATLAPSVSSYCSSLSSMSQGSSPCPSPTISTMPTMPSVSPTVNRDPNWPVTLEIPWDNFGGDIHGALACGKRLSPGAKRDIINKTVDIVRKKTERASRAQYAVIFAQRMVAKFPDSLQDKIIDSVVGSGYETVLKQLVGRNENLNRPKKANKMCLSNKKRQLESDTMSQDSGETQVIQVDKTDSYGCVNWMPEISDKDITRFENEKEEMKVIFNSTPEMDVDIEEIDKLMEVTYPLQRRDINGGDTMKNLKAEWPFLFKVQGLLNHAKQLLDIDVRLALGAAYTSKAPRLNRFFRESSARFLTFFEEATKQSEKDNLKAWLMAVVLCIMDNFGEKEKDMFFIVDETASVEEVEESATTESPVMVVLGDSVMAGKKYMVIVDRTVITPKMDSFMDAFSSFFSAYYIFNLEYQSGAASTLEFIQRCFLGINPDRGSKGNKGKMKKVNQIGPKVLKLINRLADFEWMDKC